MNQNTYNITSYKCVHRPDYSNGRSSHACQKCTHPKLKAETIPIEVFFLNCPDPEIWEEWFSGYQAFVQKFIGPNGGRRHIKLHHLVLGPRLCRFFGSECEFYVWEDCEKGWRVFISSAKGIYFETFSGVEPLIAWANYTKRFVSYSIVQDAMKS